MDEQYIDPEMMQEIEDMRMEDQTEEQNLGNQEWQEAYGAPEPEERINSSAFLNKAAFVSQDTTRTTFLHEQELGNPLFSVRFLLDMEDISKHYIDPICKQLGFDPEEYNKIAKYFKEKRENITSSGMSNKGFAMNMNVTRKMDSTRTRATNPIENLKGGDKK